MRINRFDDVRVGEMTTTPPTPQAAIAELGLLIDRAAGRGIHVVELDAGEWAVSMRGAFAVVAGADLRARLQRMGVQAKGDAAGWQAYEAHKRAWAAAHPGASAADYTQAMQRIADELEL